MKVCTKCKITLTENQFSKDNRARNKLRSTCKNCGSTYYTNHRTELNLYRKRWLTSNREAALLWAARNRAKQKGISCTIISSDIIIPEYCPVLGIKLEKGIKKLCDTSPTLDRINQKLGYIPGNIAVISFRANKIKNNATFEELQKVARWLEQELLHDGISVNEEIRHNQT